MKINIIASCQHQSTLEMPSPLAKTIAVLRFYLKRNLPQMECTRVNEQRCFQIWVIIVIYENNHISQLEIFDDHILKYFINKHF